MSVELSDVKTVIRAADGHFYGPDSIHYTPVSDAAIMARAREWLLRHVDPGTGPVYSPLPCEELDQLGFWLSFTLGLAAPTACIVHRDLNVPYHKDTLHPYPCTNIAMFWRSWGVTGGELVLPDRDLAFDAADSSVLVFDGQERHGVAPWTAARGAYRLTLTYYAPLADA